MASLKDIKLGKNGQPVGEYRLVHARKVNLSIGTVRFEDGEVRRPVKGSEAYPLIINIGSQLEVTPWESPKAAPKELAEPVVKTPAPQPAGDVEPESNAPATDDPQTEEATETAEPEPAKREPKRSSQKPPKRPTKKKKK